MRRLFHFLPIILTTLSLPAFAVQSESHKPGSKHIIQVIRSGQGQPRVRDASKARAASLRTLEQTEATKRTRPYQAAKPGEGAPKS